MDDGTAAGINCGDLVLPPWRIPDILRTRETIGGDGHEPLGGVSEARG